MSAIRKTELDPFRVILAAIAAAKDSDTLMQAVGLAGINFDGRLYERDGHSHSMRIRALLPRIQAAYVRGRGNQASQGRGQTRPL